GSLSSGTVQMNHRVLKNIFTRAVEWKIIKNNPVSSVQKPKVTSKEIVPYDENEVSQLLQALEKEPFHWRMMITLALTTGMRRGELLGLEWKHIDWKVGVIDVTQTLIQALKGEIIVKEPKTKNSRRKVALPASVLEELREYYAYRVKERDKLGDAWNGRDKEGREWNFVFSHADGTPFHHERPYLWFRQFIMKNGFRYIRFHDLRHTSATLLINQGVHAKIISERLGHGNIMTTMNIYGHALRSADQAAADKLDSLFSTRKDKHSKKTLG
ncbi:MAG: site-specific integrase, partial [Paenibacillus macerans]|nr:site-specific integrase [Paenibacillus macerans]